MKKKIISITARDNIYWEGSDELEKDIICKKGVTYPIEAIFEGIVSFKNNDEIDHRWDIYELNKDFVVNYEEEDKSLYTFTQSKLVNPKRTLENWIQTISPKKFERCVKECTELAEGLFYNEDTNCLYLHYNPMKGYTVNDESGLTTRVNFSHNSEAFKQAVKFIKVQKTWRGAFNHLKYEPVLEESVDNLKESVKEVHSPVKSDWTDKHYDFNYYLTEEEIEKGFVKLDVYKVANVWGTGSKDNSGALWHSLKTIARFGDKNPVEREIKALYEQVKGLARENGVELKDEL